MHMKDRQGMQQHIAFFPAPKFLQDEGIAAQVFVREHGAFTAAGSARGIQNRSQIIIATSDGFKTIALRGSTL